MISNEMRGMRFYIPQNFWIVFILHSLIWMCQTENNFRILVRCVILIDACRSVEPSDLSWFVQGHGFSEFTLFLLRLKKKWLISKSLSNQHGTDYHCSASRQEISLDFMGSRDPCIASYGIVDTCWFSSLVSEWDKAIKCFFIFIQTLFPQDTLNGKVGVMGHVSLCR